MAVFKEGDLVMCTGGSYHSVKKGDIRTVSGLYQMTSRILRLRFQEHNCSYDSKFFAHVNPQHNKERSTNAMKKVIAKLFERTADAVLVEKHLGANIEDTEVEYIRLNGKQKELIDVAQALEDKENKTK